MKKQILLSSLVVLVLLTGCSGTVFEVFNNTGRELTVVSYDTVGESAEYSIRAGRSHEVASPTKLVIKFDGGLWEYAHFPALDKKYRDSGGLRLRNYKFQIEKDGAIYILLPGTKTTVTNFPQQQYGFPIRPK